MLTEREAIRRVHARFTGMGVAMVVAQIWGGDGRFVVFPSLPDPFGRPPGRVRAFTVDADTGEMIEHDQDIAEEELISGLTRIPWSPYRPCDPSVTSARIRLCRVCRARLVPIMWGMPGPDLMEAAERGEVVLGGCTVSMEPPYEVKACPECGWTLMAEPNIP
jgi:hypothetical protein